MASNNIHKLEGVIYSKPVRTAPDKKGKNNGVPYEFPSIILEVKRVSKGTEYITLPEFEMGRGVNIQDFAIGDKVEIIFALEGKKISDTFHKTSAKAIYIRHTDIDYNDTRDIDRQETKRDNVFVPPPPDKEDGKEDDLPF